MASRPDSGSVKELARRILNIFSNQDINVYSGNATLYILMAMIPLLMLAVTVLNWMPFYDAAQLSRYLGQFLPDIPQVQDLINEIIMNLNQQSNVLIASVSALTTLWSASNGINSIQIGLNQVYGSKRSFVKGRAVSILFTVLLILLFPSAVIFNLLRKPLISGVTAILTRLNLPAAAQIFQIIMNYSRILTLALLVLAIVLMYTYLPRGDRTIRSQLPGALFCCVGGWIFTFLFSFFMGSFWKMSSFYGSLAAIFLTAMWLKFLLLIFFGGASLNKALEGEEPDEEESAAAEESEA